MLNLNETDCANMTTYLVKDHIFLRVYYNFFFSEVSEIRFLNLIIEQLLIWKRIYIFFV